MTGTKQRTIRTQKLLNRVISEHFRAEIVCTKEIDLEKGWHRQYDFKQKLPYLSQKNQKAGRTTDFTQFSLLCAGKKPEFFSSELQTRVIWALRCIFKGTVYTYNSISLTSILHFIYIYRHETITIAQILSSFFPIITAIIICDFIHFLISTVFTPPFASRTPVAFEKTHFMRQNDLILRQFLLLIMSASELLPMIVMQMPSIQHRRKYLTSFRILLPNAGKRKYRYIFIVGAMIFKIKPAFCLN
ncbi:hypothetical protein EGR_09241 [Echinococcus granulosus]|uniref:Uncharacterized protein n=1 Tax=Echinococcus granulosus TaxID=6210 RepID=W6UR40_ECHGR|nr:hypothetical protein EGR_09241 [Echinococcus granulosus]EUB55884.1 hypothetical protein EGR_09241 [Echinococcus granulosus]